MGLAAVVLVDLREVAMVNLVEVLLVGVITD